MSLDSKVAEAAPRPRARLWFLPLVERGGGFRLASIFGLGLVSLNLAVFSATGPSDPVLLRFALYMPIAIGYTFIFAPRALRGLCSDVPALQGIDRMHWGGQLFASAAATLVAVFLTAGASSDQRSWLLYLVAAQTLVAWLLWTPFIWVSLRALFGLRRAARESPVNLLDLQPLAAIGRAAGRIALFMAGLGVIFTLLVLVGREGGLAAELPSVVALTLQLLLTLLVPIQAARAEIRRAKRAEVTRIAAALGHHKEVLDEAEGAARVEALLAYRERILAVPEWPLRFSAGLRTPLFALLPLLSWAGAAVVERTIEYLWR